MAKVTDRRFVLLMLEQQLARRTQLLAEIAQIDQTLKDAYVLLATDTPAAVPPAPQPVVREAAHEPSTTPRAPRPAAPEPAVPPQARVTVRTGPDAPPLIVQCATAILRLVTFGVETPRDLRPLLPFHPQVVKEALTGLVKTGRLRRTGQTNKVRYELVPPSERRAPTAAAAPQPAQAPAPAKRTVVRDGVEFEVFFDGSPSSPSLLGDREQRPTV